MSLGKKQAFEKARIRSASDGRSKAVLERSPRKRNHPEYDGCTERDGLETKRRRNTSGRPLRRAAFRAALSCAVWVQPLLFCLRCLERRSRSVDAVAGTEHREFGVIVDQPQFTVVRSFGRADGWLRYGFGGSRRAAESSGNSVALGEGSVTLPVATHSAPRARVT